MVNLQGTSLRQERMISYSPTCVKENGAFAKMLGTEEETKKSSATKRGDSLERVGSSVSEEVREAWGKAEKEAGMNGMAIDSSGRFTGITELNIMSLLDIRSGGTGDILGNTKQSAMEAVQKALGKLGIPENENEKKEKLFYEAFLRYLSPKESESPEKTKAVSENVIRNYEMSLVYSKNLGITKQEITEEQIAYLQEKYDVENMSLEEYEKFMKELVEMNVISKEDVKNQFARRVTEGVRPMSQHELEESSEVFEPKNVWWGGYAGKNDLPVEYTMYYAKDSTEENPILIAAGKDEYGKAFERRIVIKEVNPRNATRIEMSALYQYYKPNEFFHHPFADNMGLDDRADFVKCYQLYADYSKESYDIFNEYKGYADFLLGIMKENGIADIERAKIPTERNEDGLRYKSELSEDEIKYLQDKFHSSNMTAEQNIDFLGELVQMGVLSEQNARNIYYGFAPLDMSKETMGKSQGKLEAYDEKKHTPFPYNEGGVIGAMNQAVHFRGFDYYKTLFEAVKHTSTVNQEESTYFKEYRNYLMILEKMGIK